MLPPGVDVAVAPDPHYPSLPQSETQSETTVEAHLIPLPESPPECATPVSVMDPIHEILDDSAAPTSITPLSADDADQVRPTETDATLPSGHNPAHPLTHAEENGGSDNQVDALQKLATDRMAVMGLRSDAQEQSKALRRLYDQSFQDLSSILAVLREHAAGQVSDQLDAISSLLSSADRARKVFHKSQERLLKVEWSMMEKEEKLYAQYGGDQPLSVSVSVSVDDLSGSLSELLSAPLPPSSNEDRDPSPLMEQSVPSIQYGVPVFEGLEETIESELKDALMESGIPSSTSPHNELNESIQMLLDSRLDNKSPNPERAGVGDISLLVRGAIDQSVQALTASGRMLRSSDTLVSDLKSRQHGSKPTLSLLSCLGSWVSDNMKEVYLANQDLTREIVLTLGYVPTSAYTVSGMSRWPAYGAPWSELTAGTRHRPDRLPDGINTPQGMIVSKYELLALGLPVSGQLDLIRSLVSEDIRETKGLLLHDWLWEADARFDHAKPNMMPTTVQTQGIQSRKLTRTTLADCSDSDAVNHRKGFPSLPIAAQNTNPVRSDFAVSRKSF